jgi:hypothetical protein
MLLSSKDPTMTRLLSIPFVLAVLLATNNMTEAKGNNSGSGKSSGSKSGSSTKHDPKGNHHPGKTYGREHRWDSRRWDSRYGCEFCYSSIDGCYFYYYAPAFCYYPVSYIAIFPPVAVAVPTAVAPVAPVQPAPLPPAAVAPVGASIQVTNINR